MRHPNQVLTRDQLISLTFKRRVPMGWTGAVDSQIARLRRQITRNGRQPVQTVYGAGYRFVCGGRMMLLRWRIMGSIVLVVALTVLTSVGVGYYATQSRLVCS